MDTLTLGGGGVLKPCLLCCPSPVEKGAPCCRAASACVGLDRGDDVEGRKAPEPGLLSSPADSGRPADDVLPRGTLVLGSGSEGAADATAAVLLRYDSAGAPLPDNPFAAALDRLAATAWTLLPDKTCPVLTDWLVLGGGCLPLVPAARGLAAAGTKAAAFPFSPRAWGASGVLLLLLRPAVEACGDAGWTGRSWPPCCSCFSPEARPADGRRTNIVAASFATFFRAFAASPSILLLQQPPHRAQHTVHTGWCNNKACSAPPLPCRPLVPAAPLPARTTAAL